MTAIHILTTIALSATVLCAGLAQAQEHHPAGAHDSSAKSRAPADDLSEGVIRGIDTANGKLTVRHGEIRNLNMGAMTMVFTLSDKAMANGLKVGDAIRFRVESSKGDLRITELHGSR